MTTFCINCRWLHSTAKTEHWWRWLCTKAPVAPHMNFVVGAELADPPYAWCRTINRDGECADYEAGPNCLSEDKYTPPKR